MEAAAVAREYQTAIVERAERPSRCVGYRGYQLIRNVLAAYAQGSSFCVIHDERRPDLREMWFEVMAAVKIAECACGASAYVAGAGRACACGVG